MKIIKYEALKNGTYKVYLSDGNILTLYEDVIVKNNLLYRNEIDDKLISKINSDNNDSSIYYTAVKYLSTRLRSIYEVKEYLKKKYPNSNNIDNIIDKLIKNKMLNDYEYAKAFCHDKLLFTSLGPYRIKDELYKSMVDNEIIDNVINDIDSELLYDKINKQINKLINGNKKKDNNYVKNKIYNTLVSHGFDKSMVIDILNEYDL